MIIDKNNPDHARLPHTAHGEVLLDEGPHISGILTAPQEVVEEALDLTDEELEVTGWSNYRKALDRMRLERGRLRKRKDNTPPAFDRVVIAREIERRKQQGGM